MDDGRELVNPNKFPSNSRFKSTSSLDKTPAAEKTKVEPLKLKGEVVVKKKSVGKILKDIFIAEDIGVVREYVVSSVVLPAIRNAIFDTITKSASMILLGRSADPGQKGSGDYRSYSNYYQKGSQKAEIRVNRLTPEQITFPYREDAEMVKGRLIDVARECDGVASVQDFFQLVGRIGEHMDNKRGWNIEDIDRSPVKIVGSGQFLIDFPAPRMLT